MTVRCDECNHFWSVHDAYGCAEFECDCLLIDRNTRFDKPNRKAVSR